MQSAEKYTGWVYGCEMQNRAYSCIVITVLFSMWTTVNPLFAPPCTQHATVSLTEIISKYMFVYTKKEQWEEKPQKNNLQNIHNYQVICFVKREFQRFRAKRNLFSDFADWLKWGVSATTDNWTWIRFQYNVSDINMISKWKN